jgi:proline iminopeptidase
MPMSLWYSSRLPPLVTQLSPQPESSSASPQPKAATSAITSFPLPPTIAIQGANDAICPPGTALDLHEVWNEMELRIVMNGGHSMYDPVVAGEIVKALDRFGHELKNELN